ncbi:MAG: mechanosensitive ion channel [SAR324 cluster bacterium]|nr:mechanosensitive ion channel [SAR324 cluster bacterium]
MDERFFTLLFIHTYFMPGSEWYSMYGSDTKLVEKTLMDIAKSYPKVLLEQEPIVLFDNFGDNALEFILLFHISIKQLLDRKRMESNLRFEIDKEFKARRIVIAFPQRDMHIDIKHPVTIEFDKKTDNANYPSKG